MKANALTDLPTRCYKCHGAQVLIKRIGANRGKKGGVGTKGCKLTYNYLKCSKCSKTVLTYLTHVDIRNNKHQIENDVIEEFIDTPIADFKPTTLWQTLLKKHNWVGYNAA